MDWTRALTYKDEAIGEQQPSSFVLYDGEAKGSAQEAGEVTAQETMGLDTVHVL
jgi:hypothetical protein